MTDMNRLIAIFFCICAICSCSKGNTSSTTGGGGTEPAVIIQDENIIGSWSVIKYEAYDRNGQLLDTASDAATIAGTYNGFNFDAYGNMTLFAKGKGMTVGYSYFASGDLFFGESGMGTTYKLDTSTFIFDSDSFFPEGWMTKYPTNTGGFYRVHCTRNPS